MQAQKFDHETLNNMTLGQLVDLFNSMAERAGVNPVKKFKDKPTAVARVRAIRLKLPQEEPRAAEEPATKTKKPRSMRFVFPPMDKVREVKRMSHKSGGTNLRGRCVEMLLRGATFKDVSQIVEQFDRERGKEPFNLEHRTYELIRIMHYYLGYGMRHNQETGVIQIYTKQRDAA